MDHSRIVQLAQFDINTDKLQDSVLESQKRLIDLNKEIYKSVQAMAQLQKSIDAANKTSDALNNSNKKTGDAYTETNKNVIELMESEKKLIQETQRLRAERDKLKADYDLQKGVLEEIRKKNIQVAASETNVADAVAREVNTRKQAKQNTKELNKLKDELNVNNKEEADLLDLINEKVNTNNKLLAESGSELEKRRANVGNYSASIQDAFANIDIMNGGLGGFIARSNQAGGAGELLKGTFTEIKTGVTGITKSLLASPLGLVLGLIGGITLLGKEFIEYNAEIAKTDKLIRGITKTSADVTTQIRILGTSMQETFGTDIEETVQTAKVLVNEFGISYEEAMGQIREGLIRGQEGNKQYLDSLREYSTFFKQAGYSVEEFRSIVSAGYDLGIYNDKLPDALKEFGLSITEQTKASRDALVNAFGTEFTESLLKRVKEGSIGVNDALKEISEQAKNSNLDLKQQAELTASVFRGAGEDAGGALKIFEAVNKAYADQTRELTELEQKTKDLADANDELAKAKDEALNSDAVNNFKKDFELLWISAKTYMYEFMATWNSNVVGVKNGLSALAKTFSDVFKQIKTIINNFDITDPLKSVREFFNIDQKKIFANNLKGIYDQQKETKKLADEEKARQDQNALNAGQEEARRKAAEEAKAKADKLDKAANDAAMKRIDLMISKQKEQLDLWIAQQGDKARTMQEELSLQEQISKKSIAILDNELKNKKITQDKYNLEVLKLSQETAKLQAEVAVQIAEKNLDTFVYENQEKLRQGQLLTDELLMQEIERNQAIQSEKDKFAKTQYDQGLINETEYQKALLENERAFLEEGKNLRERNQADNRTIETTRRAQEFQENMLILQENLASEFEIRKAQAQFELDENILQLEQQRADGLITEENYQLALTNIIANNNQVRKQIEKDLFAVKLDYAQRGLDALAQIAGKDTAAAKAVGVAKVGIDTAMAIMKSYSDLGPIGGSIFAAIVGTLGAINIKKIVSTKEPKVDTNIKGYATGGKITGGLGIKRSNGDNVLITAKRGEAILNEQQQSYIGTNLLSLAGVPGFATGGVVGSSSTSAVIQNSILKSQPFFDVDQFALRIETAVQNGSQNGSQLGSQVGSQQGISQLSSDRAMQGDSLL